jgi:polyisoprenyl-phosphate glycosyltransferase
MSRTLFGYGMRILNKDKISVSVIIPVYNAEESLPELITTLSRVLKDRYTYEMIAVNDASADKSLTVLRQLGEKNPHLFIIDLAKNSGQENAILAGLKFVRYENIVCIDDDLQHDPADIPSLLECLHSRELDIVFARFSETSNSTFRRMGTWLNDRMMNFVIEKPKGLMLTSFLAMRRFVADQVIEYSGPFPYLAGQYLSITQRVGNIDLIHHPRRFQSSNYNFRKLVKLWISGLVSFGLAPLRLMFSFSILLFLFALGSVILLIINRLVYGNLVPIGWTTMMIVILILSSVQMFGLGLLGEYIGRVLMTATRYPRYSIRTLYNFKKTDKKGNSPK